MSKVRAGKITYVEHTVICLLTIFFRGSPGVGFGCNTGPLVLDRCGVVGEPCHGNAAIRSARYKHKIS